MKKLLIYLSAALMLASCDVSSQYQTTTQKHVKEICKQAPFKMSITVPKFPGMVYNVLDYGADPMGITLSTEAIQKAIDECTEAGGGTVIINDGEYLIKSILTLGNELI